MRVEYIFQRLAIFFFSVFIFTYIPCLVACHKATPSQRYLNETKYRLGKVGLKKVIISSLVAFLFVFKVKLHLDSLYHF